ncbi:ABC transporter ATP-binding protein [Streptomyces brasiliensis]|uniref:ABC transporter ATP-binding protein n=1 Tax=Streptomyces brasiliensis TaxID=1954 RepID=A0A917P7M2_9ACTN|nr:ABC transporter ATP-binding protein [Streptomyces brasiliensis]GGJ65666.1 ABC transporter ATP-binding protein [Streptomyces brasiliensis]
MLQITGLTVKYGVGVHALQDASVDVPEGAVAAVIGGNGAGKSSLMRAISGTLGFHAGRVVEGSITYDGRNLAGLSPQKILRLGIAHVPEGRRILGEMTVLENLRAGGAIVRSTRKRVNALQEIMDRFPILAERRNQRAGLLSGGEQQILAIGRGLMSSPKVMLLDEPTLGLSPQMVERVADTIREVNASGVTVVVVEQNAAMALGVATDGHVIERGRVVLSDSAAALRDSPDVRRLFLGGDVDEGLGLDAAPASLATLTRWSA